MKNLPQMIKLGGKSFALETTFRHQNYTLNMP